MYKKVKKFFGAISPFLKKIEDDNIFAISGQSAFFLLLALIPFAMFAVPYYAIKNQKTVCRDIPFQTVLIILCSEPESACFLAKIE